jgi:transposase-like protein
MPKKRRKHNPEFKAKVAIEAVKGLKTSSEIASLYEVYPTQVSQWKKDVLEHASELFEGKRHADDQAKIEQMCQRHHAKIGQLTLEIDWLKKSARSWRFLSATSYDLQQ